MAQCYRVTLVRTGRVLADCASCPSGAAARARGLLGRTGLTDGEGLWLKPCNGIHTVGMRFGIDVIILSENLTVMAVRSRVRPWRIVLPASAGRSTLELAAGTADETGVIVGDSLMFDPVGCT